MGVQNLTGQTLGQYELRELLGAGGMGAVYRAYQPSLQRTVAIKVLKPELTSDPGYIERFTREARISAALEHPNIIPIFDYGTQQDISYLVMRLLTGGSLSERIAQRAGTQHPLPSLGEIADLLRQVGSALDYAHSQGVIHRDIKPSNIMFNNHGNAYVVDFGIAKLLEATATGLTGAGAVVGTFGYMSPEQWRNDPMTPATDQYALGVLTYALVTGRMPFDAPTPAGVMHKHLNDRPTPVHAQRPDVPEAVTYVIERALAKSSADRFPTCTAFAQAFDGAIRGNTGEKTAFFKGSLQRKSLPSGVFTPSPSVPVTATRPLHKTPAFWAMGVIIVAMAAVIAFLVLGWSRGIETAGLSPADQTRTLLAALPTAAETQPTDVTQTLFPSATPEPSTTPAETSEPTLSATVVPTYSATEIAETLQAEMVLVLTENSQTTEAIGATTAQAGILAAQTAEAISSATSLAGTQAVQALQGAMTQTATRWTATPTLDLRATAAYRLTQTQAVLEAQATQDAAATGTELARGLMATAALWTPTPSETATVTSSPLPTWTSSPTPTPTSTLTPTSRPTRTPSNTPAPTDTLTPSRTPRPVATLPAYTASDFVFDLSRQSNWEPYNMTRGSRPGEWAIRFDPYLDYTMPLEVCLDDYSHVSVTLAVPLYVANRTLEVYYILDGRGEFSEARVFRVPLASTDEVQTYVYPTSRVPHTQGSRLTGIRLDPAGGSMAQAGRVTITDFRLIRSNMGPSLCQAAEQVFAVVRTVGSGVALRAAPAFTGEMIAALSPGARLPVTGRTEDSSYVRVEYRGQEGWIFWWFVEIEGGVDAVPVVEVETEPTATRTPAPLPESVRFEFDRAVPGVGWNLPERHDNVTFVWMDAKTATLRFPFQPSGNALVTVRVDMDMNPAIVRSLTMKINGTPVPFTSTASRAPVTLQAIVPHQILAASPETITLEFNIDQVIRPADVEAGSMDWRTLGLAFDWIEVRPWEGESIGGGSGLLGEYFDNMNLTNQRLVRVDRAINFNWGERAPDQSVWPETFSVRWTGQIQPLYSERYTFTTISDDGVRLWIDGRPIINAWYDQDSGSNSGTITLVAGRKYDIRLEFYDNAEVARIELYWSSPSQLREIVPRSQLYPAETLATSTPQPPTPTRTPGPTATPTLRPPATPWPTRTPTPTLTAANTFLGIILQTDFSGRLSEFYTEGEGWRIVSEGDEKMYCVTYSGGRYGDFPAVNFRVPNTLRDYLIQARVRFTTANGHIALMTRLSSSHSGYRHALQWGAEGANISQYYYPADSGLGYTSVSVRSGEWHTLRAEVQGDAIRTFLDERLLASDTDRTRSMGFAAVESGPNTDVCIDDLIVRSLNASPEALQAVRAAVATGNANMRNGPGTDFLVVGNAAAGDRLYIMEWDAGRTWAFVRNDRNRVHAWISADLIRVQ